MGRPARARSTERRAPADERLAGVRGEIVERVPSELDRLIHERLRLGIVSALAVYGLGARWQVGLGPLRPVYRLVANRYYLDDLYERGIAGSLVYGVVGGLGRLLDTRLIDGIVNGVAWGARRLAFALTRVQSGQEQAYGLVFVGGLALVAAVMFAVAT